MTSSYWQIKVAQEDRPKTAFSIGSGLHEFRVMPFGLATAANTFERLAELVLSGLTWKSCLVYLDDIVVFSFSFQEQIERLQEMKGLEAKGPFSCLGLQVRFKRAYQTLINYSFLWHVKSYLNSFSNYLTIIFESYVVLMNF